VTNKRLVFTTNKPEQFKDKCYLVLEVNWSFSTITSFNDRNFDIFMKVSDPYISDPDTVEKVTHVLYNV